MWIFISFLLIFLTYFKTLSITIFGGDSGDLVSAVLTQSFAHPPGYPLFVLLGIIFNKIFFFLPVIQRISLLSLFSTFLSFFFLFKILRLFYLKYNKGKLNIYIFFFSLIFFGFNYIIWLYSITVEVFSLNALISVIIFYFAVSFYVNKNFKDLYYLFFFIGLGFAHHHSFVLVLPSVIYLIWPELRVVQFSFKKILNIFIYFFLGFSFNFFLFWSSWKKSELNWGYVDSISDFFSVFLRKVYGTFQAGPFVTQIFEHRLLQIKNLFIYLLSDFSLVGVFLIGIGIFYIIKSLRDKFYKRLSYSVLITIVLTGPFFFLYANFPLNSDFSFATMERFLFLFYIFLFIPFYFGVEYLFSLINSNKIFSSVSTLVLKLGVFILLLFVSLFISFRNYQSIKYLSMIKMPELLAEDILKSVPKNSILILSDDTPLFNTQYLYYLNKEKYFNERKIVLHGSKLSFDYYYLYLKENYPFLKIPSSNDPLEFLDLNYSDFNIYTNSRYEFVKNTYYWQNLGLLYKLSKEEPDYNKDIDKIKRFWTNSNLGTIVYYIKEHPLAFRNLFWMDVRKVYSIGLQNSAFAFIKAKDYDGAMKYAEMAYFLYPMDPDSLYLQAEIYYAKKNCSKAFNIIKKALSQKEDILYYTFLDKISNCFSENSPERQYIESILEKRLKTPLE